MVRARWLAAAALLAAAACGSETDDRPRSWSYIVQTILRPSCATASCHSHLTATAGLQLEEIHGAYVFLVGYPTGAGNFVKPGDPQSQLLKLLRGTEIWRMPPDQPLPEADIELIESWILDGAPEN